MEAFLDPNWPPEATSKASPIKYANEEGARSIAGDQNAGFRAPWGEGNREGGSNCHHTPEHPLRGRRMTGSDPR